MDFNIWPKFGFDRNPYGNEPLPATEEGSKLLVGRDHLVSEIQASIASGGTHPSVEGPVGVGKSSLVDVAVFRMYEASLTAKDRVLFLPTQSRLEPIEDIAEFTAQVYRLLAETVISHADDFMEVGLNRPDMDGISKWLNDPLYKSWQAGGGVALLNASAGHGEEGNTSSGFERNGFYRAVETIINDAYAGGEGAIVVQVDNIELSETVKNARALLDKLRDSALQINHVRWVFSGARGLLSRARNDRLTGYIAAPIKLAPLRSEDVFEALSRRIASYGRVDATPPVTPEGFSHIYAVFDQNLRDSLAEAQAFAQKLNRDYLLKGLELPLPDELDLLLTEWLFERAQSAFGDAKGIRDRTWQFFDDLCAAGGACGSAENKKFGFEKQPNMVNAVSQLLEANLVGREKDPENRKLTRNAVTPSGWLVRHYRMNSESI